MLTQTPLVRNLYSLEAETGAIMLRLFGTAPLPPTYALMDMSLGTGTIL
jgi:hypothetical protein